MNDAGVLVVEDDHASRGVIARGLRGVDLEVATAGGGTAAMSAIDSEPDTGCAAVVADDTLDQYLARMRRTLAAVGTDGRGIGTVDGVGYRSA